MVRFRIAKAGYEPLEAGTTPVGPPVEFALSRSNTAPAGMLHASGGPATVSNRTVILDDYWIDRFEVTNREFKKFVDAGGYRTRTLLDRAVRVGHADAVVGRGHGALSRHAPASPDRPPGSSAPIRKARPTIRLSGVSWYEAAAYAAFVGKSLPTAFHWYRAAGFGQSFRHSRR